MESEIVWDKFRGPGYLEPYIVHFPNYTKGELYFVYTIKQTSSKCIQNTCARRVL